MSEEENDFSDIEEQLEMRRGKRQTYFVEQSHDVLSTLLIMLDTKKPVSDLELCLYRSWWEAARVLGKANLFADQEDLNDQLEAFRQKWDRQ